MPYKILRPPAAAVKLPYKTLRLPAAAVKVPIQLFGPTRCGREWCVRAYFRVKHGGGNAHAPNRSQLQCTANI